MPFITYTIGVNAIDSTESGADPEFSVGGANPIGGGDIQCEHFSTKTYAEAKELFPLEGGRVWIRQCELNVFLWI